MKIWLSSDTHYMHNNIIRYCERPFTDVDHMNEQMMSRWNSVVSDDDIVVHVGDVSAGVGKRINDLQNIISSLKGQKLLIRGNHDHQTNDWYVTAGFKKVIDHINLSGIFLTHYPLENMIQNGFDFSGVGTINYVIHGHNHRTDTPNYDDHFNVAVDRNNFTPVEDVTVLPEQYLEPFRESLIKFMM